MLVERRWDPHHECDQILRGSSSSLVFATIRWTSSLVSKQTSRRSPAGLFFVVHVRECLAVVIANDEAGAVVFSEGL